MRGSKNVPAFGNKIRPDGWGGGMGGLDAGRNERWMGGCTNIYRFQLYIYCIYSIVPFSETNRRTNRQSMKER